MSTIVKELRLILTDSSNNNNKFWHGYLFEDGTVKSEWGRVGKNSQTKEWPGAGEHFFRKKEQEKRKKGYDDQRTIVADSSNTSSRKLGMDSNLKDQAVRDIGGSPEIQKLVRYLVDANIHTITSNTNIKYNVNTGAFTTPLGLVTKDGIDEARQLLNDLAVYVNNKDWENSQYRRLLEKYMQIIPTDVGMRRGWHKDLFASKDALIKQNDILDSLDASLQTSLTTTNDTGEEVKEEKVFEVKLDVIEDSKIFKRVQDFYNRTKGGHYDVKDLDVRRVYSVNIPTVVEAFKKDGKKVGNIKQLWHGTKASNLLSILKIGLIIPSSNSGHVTGRMFGNGVYFSDQSTKAIRYATNAWTGGGNTDKTFMFLADVAMGNPYTPRTSNWQLTPPPGYDSVFAKGGYSSVQNNEMIVFRLSQINLVYLIEFTKHGR